MAGSAGCLFGPWDTFLLLPGRGWLLPQTANAGAGPHPTLAHQMGFLMFRSLQKVNAVGICRDCTVGQDYCTNKAGHWSSCRDVPQQLDTQLSPQLSRNSTKPRGSSQPAAPLAPHPQCSPGVSAGWSSPAVGTVGLWPWWLCSSTAPSRSCCELWMSQGEEQDGPGIHHAGTGCYLLICLAFFILQ